MMAEKRKKTIAPKPAVKREKKRAGEASRAMVQASHDVAATATGLSAEKLDALMERHAKQTGKLPMELRRVVVQLLACRFRPKQVIEIMRDEFGVVLAPSEVTYYNPTTAQGRTLQEELKTLFFSIRAEHDAKMQDTNITSMRYRMQELDEIYLLHRDRGNLVAAAAVLEQAAKEVGGMNVKTQPAAVSRTIQEQQQAISMMSHDEKAARIVEFLRLSALRSGGASVAHLPPGLRAIAMEGLTSGPAAQGQRAAIVDSEIE